MYPGVPQGSILGPLLFLIYINDIVNCTESFKTVLFADDTTLYASHRNLNDLIHTVNIGLNTVHDWMLANKLTLNITKTKYLLHHRKKLVPQNLEPIKIGNSILSEDKSVKFLGVLVDRELKWIPHIQHVKNKINKQCGILYLTRRYFGPKSLKQLYYSLIYPFLIYCHTIWGNAGKTKLNKIEIAQKRAIRTITFTKKKNNKYPPSNEQFKSLRLLKLSDINIFCSANFVYKSINNHNHVRLFSYRSNERYNLRNNSDLEIPSLSTNQSQTSISYRGVKVWNDIPRHIQTKTSLTSFKITLKSYLLNKY